MRCAVLGSPIGHSLSPVLHREAYAALGLADWRYDAVEVEEAGLAGFVAGLDDSWRGLSLTMPLKRAVLPLLDEVSETARRAGAANTVLIERAGVPRLVGDNTDVPGAVAAVRKALYLEPQLAIGHAMLVALYGRLGQPEESERARRNALRALEGLDDEHVLRGVEAMTAGGLRRALVPGVRMGKSGAR